MFNGQTMLVSMIAKGLGSRWTHTWTCPFERCLEGKHRLDGWALSSMCCEHIPFEFVGKVARTGAVAKTGDVESSS